MLPKKVREAIILGVSIWIAGALSLAIFGQRIYFSEYAVPVSFIIIPAMIIIARWHFRDIESNLLSYSGLRLGVVTAIQSLLDGVIVFGIGWPPLSQSAYEILPLALLTAYFWMLVIPWWQGHQI